MEQLIALILFALVSFISWSIQKSQEKRQERARQRRADQGYQEEPAHAAPPAHSMTDSEAAMRRLREALGLPDDEEIAPPPQRRPVPPPFAEVEQEDFRPVVYERPVAVPPPIVREYLPPPLPVPERPVVVAVEEELRRKFTAPSRKAIAETVAAQPALDVRALLKSPGGLRDAVVLSEVLGRPKSLAG